MEGVQQRGVDLQRRWHAVVAGRHAILRRREVCLVGCWSGPQYAGVRARGTGMV